MLTPRVSASFALAGMTSALGKCHTFDARADGYARGEACCAWVLRPLQHDDDGTPAQLGSCVRNDGRSASLTAPNGQAQQRLLVAALADAGTPIESLSLNEAHGTGTALGDPIEAASLVQSSTARCTLGRAALLPQQHAPPRAAVVVGPPGLLLSLLTEGAAQTEARTDRARGGRTGCPAACRGRARTAPHLQERRAERWPRQES